jgi:DNA-binding MarR family transcriptional regulator
VTQERMGELDRLVRSLVESLHVDDPGFWGSRFKGMPLQDIHALVAIAESGGGRIKELRASLGVPNSTMTGILDRLEEGGLLERTLDAGGRRSFGLVVTKKGRLAVADHERGHEAVAKAIASRLTEAELSSLIRILSKVEGLEPKEEGR